MFSLFLSRSLLVLAWSEALMVFFNFFNFFAISLEFSIMATVGIDQNDNFYLLSFSAFPNLFWLKEKPHGVLYFFEFFCYFLNFLLWVGKELIGTIIFIFSLSWPFPTRLEEKPKCFFIIFWIFLLFFWIFLLQVG